RAGSTSGRPGKHPAPTVPGSRQQGRVHPEGVDPPLSFSGCRKGALQPGWHRNALVAQERRIEQLALIARARVGEQGDNGVTGAELAGQADGTGEVDAAGAAHVEAL